MAARMRAFGTPTVVNPFDRFGDHLRIALRAPASYQLMTWLESGPGRSAAAHAGPAVARALDDLRVRPLRAGGDPRPARRGSRRHVVEPSDVAERSRRDRRRRLRAGRAGRGRDRARRRVRRRHGQRHHQPVADRRRARRPTRRCSSRPGRTSRPARRCSPPSRSTRCSCPPRSSRTRCTRSCPRRCCGGSCRRCPGARTLGRRVIGRLTQLCGKHLQALWKVRLRRRRRRRCAAWLAQGGCALGDLLRNPDDRDEPCTPSCCSWPRGATTAHLGAPRRLRAGPDDELLLVGAPAARRLLDSAAHRRHPRVVLHGRHVPSSWIWRRITRRYRSGEGGRGCGEGAARGGRRRCGRFPVAGKRATGTSRHPVRFPVRGRSGVLWRPGGGSGWGGPGAEPAAVLVAPAVVTLCHEDAALARVRGRGAWPTSLTDAAALAVRSLPSAQSARIRVRVPGSSRPSRTHPTAEPRPATCWRSR